MTMQTITAAFTAFTIVLTAANSSSAAAPTLAPLFRNAAVLQRDKPVPVWGQAAAGETVAVEFKDQRKQTVADAQGWWRLTLDAMPASAEPAVMRVVGAAPEDVTEITGILVGEVWFCSGQSNMAWTVQNSMNPAEELAAANFPFIRHFRMANTRDEQPLNTTESLGSWAPVLPGTAHDGDKPTSARAFSAVAYFFAREIHQKLGVPVGVINSSVGGTTIEAWTSTAALEKSPWWPGIQQRWRERLDAYPALYAKYEQQLAEWKKAEAQASVDGKKMTGRAPRPPEGPGSRWMPGGLFNGMVQPAIPYAMRGFIWYQGESNASRYAEYPQLVETMIKQWRQDFQQGDLPFYFVQIASLDIRTDATNRLWAFQREAQSTALSLPNTGMAVTIDIGEPHNVHPKNKQDVGKRLALIALAKTYGIDVPHQGPTFREAKVEGAKMRIIFDHAAGLVLRPTDPENDKPAFELAGEDKVFHPAEAVVDGQTLLVSSPQVSKPVDVRYAWHNYPPVPLYNGASLPAPPFRTDDWPHK